MSVRIAWGHYLLGAVALAGLVGIWLRQSRAVLSYPCPASDASQPGMLAYGSDVPDIPAPLAHHIEVIAQRLVAPTTERQRPAAL